MQAPSVFILLYILSLPTLPYHYLGGILSALYDVHSALAGRKGYASVHCRCTMAENTIHAVYFNQLIGSACYTDLSINYLAIKAIIARFDIINSRCCILNDIQEVFPIIGIAIGFQTTLRDNQLTGCLV